MDTPLNLCPIKNETSGDPVLTGSKIFPDKETILSRDVLNTPLNDSGDIIRSAEIEFMLDGRHLFAHVVSNGMGDRFSLSEESIMKKLKAVSFTGKNPDETLKQYMKAVCSVQCLQAFGGNMVPVSRFYYFYCELEKMLGEIHTHTGL